MPGKCRFKTIWLTDPDFSTWLKPAKSEKDARCIICKTEFSIMSSGVTQVRQHARGKAHLQMISSISKQPKILQNFQKLDSNAINSENTQPLSDLSVEKTSVVPTPVHACSSSIPILPKEQLRDSVTRAEIYFAFKLVASHSANNFAANLPALLKKCFYDSEIVDNFTLSPSKAAYVISFGLAHYYKRKLDDIMMKSEFLCAQFDESLNKISQKGQMDLHIRFMDENGLVQSRYITSAFLGRATAQHLLESLKSCFPDIPTLKKVVQLSMDGPNVNWKLLDYFMSEMAENPSNPKVLNIGSCGLHVIHGAFKAGFRESN